MNNAIDRVLKKHGPEALTVDRLEGIKELVTQHLWSPALTELSKNLPASETETSETSDSTKPKSSDSESNSQPRASAENKPAPEITQEQNALHNKAEKVMLASLDDITPIKKDKEEAQSKPSSMLLVSTGPLLVEATSKK